MLRLVALLLIAAGLTANAQACDMRTAKRASVIADYVENGLDCLQNPTASYRFDAAMERAFVAKINAERSQHGLQALIVRSELRPAARFHSLDMGVNGFFGHETPRGKLHPQRVAAFDRTLLPRMSAENVAQLQHTCQRRGRTITCPARVAGDGDLMVGAVDELHRQLMESAGHRKNILSPKTTHIALGVARRDHGVYVTQIFIKPAGFLDRPLPLRMRAGSQMTIIAQTPGWPFKNFALMRNDAPSDLIDGRIPLATRGDLNLNVRGERKGEKTRSGNIIRETYEYIYLSGPAVTIVSPTESSQSLAGAS